MQGRLVGIDVARCLALLGMVSTHVLVPVTDEGEIAWAQDLAGGRAAALFAVLAGVSLALLSGRRLLDHVAPLHSLSLPRSPRNHAAACRARSRQSSRSSPQALT